MKKNFIFVFVACFFVFSTTCIGGTFSKYTGRDSDDKAFAKSVYNLLHKHGVYAVEVNGSIMAVHVTEELYRGIVYDKIKGRQTCRNLGKMLQKYVGQKPVNVWIFFDGTKVIDADYNIWDKRFDVEFLD